MNQKEKYRIQIIEQVIEKKLNQTEAARILRISPRHFRRLLKRYREEGKEGILSQKRGKPSNRKYDEKTKKRF